MTPVIEYLKHLAEHPELEPNDKDYNDFKKSDTKDCADNNSSLYFKDFMELIDSNMGSDVFLQKVEGLVSGSEDKKVKREAILKVLGESNLV